MMEVAPSPLPDVASRLADAGLQAVFQDGGDAPRDPSLALFGHDLRAALADVVGGMRFINLAALDAMTRSQIDRVRISAEMLAQLLEQGLSEMLGEAPPARPAHLNLHRFLTDVDLRWSGRALENGIAFSLHRGANLPVTLHLDRLALDRVLSNLLGNAFKYCGRGRVALQVDTRRDGSLRLLVRDDGPGFPVAVLDRIRPEHKRANDLARPGSGMGLRIAADLAHRFGGRLTLRNIKPEGAEAQVDLPVLASVRARLTDVFAPQPANTGSFLAGRRVLIADDTPTSQALVFGLVSGFGGQAVVVDDGLQAIGRLERDTFDLLIVDAEMPQLSGLDVIRHLRKLPGPAAHTPAIMVTAHGEASSRKSILAAGANALLTKPLLCSQAFADVVRSLLTAQPSPVTGFDLAPADNPQQTFGIVLDRLGRLMDMADPETGLVLLKQLISDLCGVQSGLTRAGSEPDWTALQSHSHVLISLAGTVGALQLQAAAEALNLFGHRENLAAVDGALPGVLSQLDALIDVLREVGHARGLAPTR